MGDGLEKQAGGKLKTILEKLTANPVKGFLLGAAVTAVIQSSSATTVMVVGFVNAGIMKLSQAIGIIMGANVGTTITSWILSLTGLQGDSFWIQLLKPTSFSPIIAFFGIILIMFSKKEGKKDLGSTLIGFAVLMFGMEQMSSAVEPLADVPEFTSILLLFSNPLLGVLCGAILTAVIQSSSASVGILQALSATGSVTYSSAIPIILGQNIGTCVTALISSIGANKNARRAAVVHLYFNLIGTGLFLAVFYLLNGFLHFSFYDQSIDRLGIAVVHTCFNLLSMARLAQSSLYQAIGLIGAYDEKIAHSIEEGEDQIDMYEDKLGTYLVRLSSKNLTMEESREISKLLHVIGDFERIGDHAVNILKSAKEMQVKKYVFSGQAQQEISIISSAIEEIVDLATNAFVKNDLYLASKVEPLEQVVDSLKDELRNRHVQRLQNGECTISNGFIFSDLITNYERVADHCSNIGVCILRIAEDSFDTHEYLNHVKDGHDDTFENRYNRYKEKYQLA